MKVTAQSGGVGGNGVVVRVWVLTGASTTAFGGTGSQSSNAAAAHQASVTTQQTGSLVYGVMVNATTGSTWTAVSGTTIKDTQNDSVNGDFYGTCRTTATTGTPGATTVGTSAPSSPAGSFAALEILPNGTITEDASGPAFAFSSGATSVQTADFTPPGGSLLVALATCNGGAGVTTMTVSDTTGLVWTERIKGNASSASYAGVWTAVVPASPPDRAEPLQPPGRLAPSAWLTHRLPDVGPDLLPQVPQLVPPPASWVLPPGQQSPIGIKVPWAWLQPPPDGPPVWRRVNTCEGSNGVTVSTANSGGPDQFSSIGASGAGNTLTYDSSQSYNPAGSTSIKPSLGGTSGAQYVVWTFPYATQGANTRIYVRLPSLPAANQRLFAVVDAAGSLLRAGLYVDTAGHLLTVNSAGTTIRTSATVLPTNAWVRIEFDVTGHASAGTINARIYATNPESTNPDESLFDANVNTGGLCGQLWAGLTATATNYAYNFDELLAVSSGPTGPLGITTGPAVSATAGVATSSVTGTSATTADTANAGVASSTTVATPATTAVAVNAGVATVGAVSTAATAAVGAKPGAAASSVIGTSETVAESANASFASSTAVSAPPVPAVAANAGVAAVSASATDAGHGAGSQVAASSVVSAPPVPAVTANAGVAAAGAHASAPTAAVSGATTAAVVPAQAPPPVVSIKPNAGVATAAAVSASPVIAEQVNTTAGVVGVVAPQPTVSTSSGVNAPAGVAASAVQAPAPVTAVTANAGVATVGSVATPVSMASARLIGVAAVGVTAGTPTTAVRVTSSVATAGSAAGLVTVQITTPTSAGRSTIPVGRQAGAHPSSAAASAYSGGKPASSHPSSAGAKSVIVSSAARAHPS